MNLTETKVAGKYISVMIANTRIATVSLYMPTDMCSILVADCICKRCVAL
jgi:hypothetical protein